ncbi:MAG: DUF2318 domain-containing protein [Eubacteriales bacterium]|uniref:DUF2318 domain-containing protein n=1 Tax=Fenollaria sp. TaxID=1965292 RepID=UPI002A76373E|nr:DUF2318 domain-containing protein [Fenollaria sp.]MDD7340228.1 DUF2318 domain-containing protein [Eubacteriales bacterium]MDY3105833.1 DUF2318 domain-containing protein [Fenollaria sp.]
MLKIFIKVLEAGVGFAFIMGLALGYLSTENFKNKYKIIFGTVFVGTLAAIISSIIREIPNFVNRSALSFWSMVPIVIAFIGIIIFYFLKEKSSIYKNIFVSFLSLYIIASFFYYMPALFVQLNNFVYYGESAVSTMVLYRIIGYVFAVVLMILSSIAIFKIVRRIDKTYRDKILIISFSIWGINQIFIVLQRLYAIDFIPRNASVFNTIAWVINHSHYIGFGLMIFLIILPTILYLNNIKVKETFKNPAELRKKKYHMRCNRNLAKFFLVLIAINVFSLTYLRAYSGRDIALSEPEEYVVENDTIIVPLSELEDMKLHRYQYTATDGVHMRFFLIKKSQGSYGVVLDACEICGPSGYYERGDDVICKLCDVIMNRGTIGFKGGCNPIPIPYIVHDEKIKISTQDLDANSFVFK